MFIYDFIQLDSPFPIVRARVEGGGRWLEPLAAGAYADGDELRVRIGPADVPRVFNKEVSVAVGPARQRGDGVVLPLRLEATSRPSLFPVLEADLELAPLGSSMTQVTLWGSCAPPLGAVGRGLDRVVLHRLAEATIRSFLRRLVAALRDDDDEHGNPRRHRLPFPAGPGIVT